MPATLAHLGVQGLATRALLGPSDARWVLLGCVIPDLPWILQRALRPIPALDLYDLRLYAVVQASLLGSLLLCGSLALLARDARRVFTILSLNVLLHLLLDATETKWANGVNLLAPFSWELWNLGWYWPESPVVPVLSVWGLLYGVWVVLRRTPAAPGRVPLDRARLALAALLALAYLAVPLALQGAPEAADSHFVRTLREREARPGRAFECDRCQYLHDVGPSGALQTFARERLGAENLELPESATVSVQGRFTDVSTVRVERFHRHAATRRDLNSYLGLALVAMAWATPRRLRRGAAVT